MGQNQVSFVERCPFSEGLYYCRGLAKCFITGGKSCRSFSLKKLFSPALKRGLLVRCVFGDDVKRRGQVVQGCMK